MIRWIVIPERRFTWSKNLLKPIWAFSILQLMIW